MWYDLNSIIATNPYTFIWTGCATLQYVCKLRIPYPSDYLIFYLNVMLNVLKRNSQFTENRIVHIKSECRVTETHSLNHKYMYVH